MLHLSAAGTHTEFCLLAFCQKRDKHLFLLEDSDPDSFVKGQEDGMQGSGSHAQSAPSPPTNPGTRLIQTLTA